MLCVISFHCLMVGMLCEGGRRGVCGGVSVLFWIFFIAGASGVEENNRRREERDGRSVVVQVRESLRNI